jgi:hypothetical protein
MATFEITAPDGRKFKVQGETREGALRALQQHIGQPDVAKPEKKVGHVGGVSGNLTQGALMGFGDEYLAGLSAVMGVEPDGEGGADWFKYEMPFKERYGVALEAIRKDFDQYGEDHPYMAGGSQIAGAIGTAVAGAAKAPVSLAKTAPGRVAQVTAAGASAGAVEGFGSGEGGFGNRMVNAGVGAGVGAAFAPLVGYPLAKVTSFAKDKGGAALAAVFRNRRMYNHNAGQLTDQGRKRLVALGFEPNELSDEMQRAFGDAAETATRANVTDPAAIERMAKAERFGVPLTTGQVSGDVTQNAAEEGYRAGVRGQRAQQTMDAFDTRQRAAVEQARDTLGGNVAAPAVDRVDAADAVISGVRANAEAARLAGSQAYKAIDEMGAGFSGPATQNLGDKVRSAARMSGFNVDASTPNAQQALTYLQNTFSDVQGSVSFSDIERARQTILRNQRAAMSGANGADQTMMSEVVNAFDGWLDDTMTSALIQGDAGALTQAKEARALWSKYRNTYLSKKGADNFIRKIVEDDISPDQVASWLYGAATTPGGGQTSLVAARIKNILGADSPEWGMVKRAAWDHITKAPEGKNFGPQRVASNLSEFIHGKGKTLSRELFTPAEIRQIDEFREMIKVLVPPPKSTNPSGSGYEIQRGMQQLVGTLVGAGAAGPIGAAAGRQISDSGSDFTGAMLARAAARGIVKAPTSPGLAVGVGVGTGAAAQEQTVR